MADDGVPRILCYFVNFVIFFVTNCYGLFAYVMWMVTLLPIRPFFPSVYWRIEATLFRGLQTFIILWMGTRRYRIVESGDDVSKLSDQEAVVMCNHQSTADTPLVMMALWNKGQGIHNCTWVMDWLFRYTNFGLVSTLRQDVFIRQGKETRHLQGAMLKEHLKNYYLPQQRKWIVLFPEGGFLHKRLEASQSYAKKNGYPVLQNVTLPRLGALKTIIDTVGIMEENAETKKTLPSGRCYHEPDRPLRWLIDMTIGYKNEESGPPDMFGMCIGYREEQDIHVHYRAYPLSEVPRDEERLMKWIYSCYQEKDDLLSDFNTNGHFSPNGTCGQLPTVMPAPVNFDWAVVALFQGFYLISAWFYYSCIVKPLMLILF